MATAVSTGTGAPAGAGAAGAAAERPMPDDLDMVLARENAAYMRLLHFRLSAPSEPTDDRLMRKLDVLSSSLQQTAPSGAESTLLRDCSMLVEEMQRDVMSMAERMAAAHGEEERTPILRERRA